MNVYDFDHTIYNGDCSLDFACFCIKRHWLLCFFVPFQIAFVFCIKLGIVSSKRGKELFFAFLRFYPVGFDDIMTFWHTHKQKITSWYFEHQRPDDLIITASPGFLIKPFVESELNKKVIATQVDIHSGKISGDNCKGNDKVSMFQKFYSNSLIENCYSDSLSDAPLARLARHAFLVKHRKNQTEVIPWPELELL